MRIGDSGRGGRWPALFLVVLLLGAGLRFVPIWFGLPSDSSRPDEAVAIGHALGVLAGDPNPHFFDWPSLTFYLFAGAFAAASGIHRLVGATPAMSVNEQFLVARGVVALAGVLTIAVLFVLARRMTDEATATIAAFFLAVAPLHVRDSHFAMTDVLATLFVTVSLAFLVHALDAPADPPGRGRGLLAWLAAGVAGGLAASTKYSAAAILVAAVAAAYLRARTSKRAFASSLAVPVLVFLVAFACAFVAGTPYAVLDYRSASAGLYGDLTHLSGGHGGVDLGMGWTYHLAMSLPYGLGWPVFVAAIPGVFIMAASCGRPAFVVGAFWATLYVCLGPGRTVFFRYVLPLIPVACLSAAVALRHVGGWLQARTSLRPVVPLLAVAIGLVSLVNSVWSDVLLSRTDTRVLAGGWLAARVTPDEVVYDAGVESVRADLLGVRGHRWSRETYDSSSREFKGSNGRLPDWLVLPESPLHYPDVPDALRSLAADRYVAVRTIRATRPEGGDSIYDMQDAFFLPISGFGPVIRPGPTLRIYRLSASRSSAQ